ncbi:hypothetical protein [Streptomyces sp. UNOC14_S4]|uniref:hypothetical protein n=1 Tax=Streptomyces sp. UNOC14_S4 TaxID=2872340 RepID=UPI001E444AE5|nr:hypothetical protein [Streptomyces sp. UNOC14_S4]MCC3769721.1 hypothetical protein [Streptomyces sp. UNOC14_S4]
MPSQPNESYGDAAECVQCAEFGAEHEKAAREGRVRMVQTLTAAMSRHFMAVHQRNEEPTAAALEPIRERSASC